MTKHISACEHQRNPMRPCNCAELRADGFHGLDDVCLHCGHGWWQHRQTMAQTQAIRDRLVADLERAKERLIVEAVKRRLRGLQPETPPRLLEPPTILAGCTGLYMLPRRGNPRQPYQIPGGGCSCPGFEKEETA